MNHVVLIGRLKKDPELRYTANTQIIGDLCEKCGKDFEKLMKEERENENEEDIE